MLVNKPLLVDITKKPEKFLYEKFLYNLTKFQYCLLPGVEINLLNLNKKL